MSDPFELLASRLEVRGKVRHFAANQLRSACPACGGKNTSTLSVKRGDSGAVLVKCWKSACSPDTIAEALGLELADLFPPRSAYAQGGAPPARRRSLLPAVQALELINHETNLVAVSALNLAHGLALSDAARERLLQAASRINYLMSEVYA